VRRGALLAAALAAVVAGGCDDDDREGRRPPNVVVIMTDDQRVDDMAVLPAVRRSIVRRGAWFENSYVSFPLCCPSRATLLTGQYAHNHGVLDNRPPRGGYYRLDSDETLPVWLQRAGYETAHVGKYLNAYGTRDREEVPPGWDEWHGVIDPTTYYYRGYVLNENGRLVRPGRYQTDELTDRALRFVREAEPPFFLSLAYLAPHDDRRGGRCIYSAKPAPRHAGRFAGARMPRPPSFGEPEMSDKPRFLRSLPFGSFEIGYAERQWRCRRESLLAVDEGVERIVRALRRAGALDRTLILFTSDNGYLLGEHRLADEKINVYEESVRVPLAIRGPGVPAGERVPDPVTNVDLAPTIMEVAGADAGLEMDGRSLLPLARRPGRHMGRALLLENLSRPYERRYTPYVAVRWRDHVYVEYRTGDRELYDLRRDPHQLRNLAGASRHARLEGALAKRLSTLRDCRGADCRPMPH
jgi:N-acetylglucosamine-6-sulfatase